MGDIAVITDSCADLGPEIAALHNITVVPMTLTIAGESMPDGTLDQREFFARMNAAPQLPTTSQPAVGSFIEVYEHALQSASHVVSVHISSKLSGTIASAMQAAERFAGRVHVIDTMNLSWGQGLQVLEAAKAVAAGLDVKGVIDRVERARDRVQMIVGLDGLDNIVKGGRIPKVAGAIGGALKVKMLITPKDGMLVPVRPVRGTRAHLEAGVKWVEEHMGDARSAVFSVMHALGEDSAHWLERAIRERYDVAELYFVEVGSVIATHTGTGWGVAFIPQD